MTVQVRYFRKGEFGNTSSPTGAKNFDNLGNALLWVQDSDAHEQAVVFFDDHNSIMGSWSYREKRFLPAHIVPKKATGKKKADG